ncbi:MAG: type II secretion system protein GspG [Candidatus Omnitrophica bacterium]|nr:type II secretion system protein GspG [Candidatus Omnitrophota bacterium]MBU2044300.1 type II secretion system protein GspG [Candidatus Omnitrophota bacterium]MBU2250859.1 type II secretion system protein GspG [Candidatus Omnitrophota bacterium]MBU2266334.1 type II secretion system protein GspG [Candidatus Omnitrophota bacterium]MBU2473317.1 type II secretion system protein GspG [Candidatus Omnitrophota bacterium]
MKKSFTLIELIVVIAIIAILAAIIAPNAFKAIEKAKVAKTVADLKSIVSGITTLYIDTQKVIRGCPPFRTGELEILVTWPEAGLLTKPEVEAAPFWGCQWTQTAVDAWDGPYIEGTGLDPWQSAYVYDSDYAFCNAITHPQVETCQPIGSFSIQEECKQACGGNLTCVPPVLHSWGKDRASYTCDDIIVQMTVN